MRLDPRTKLLILAVTSVSVFMNKSIAVECVLAGIPLVLLSTSGNLKRMLKYAAFFLTLLLIQLFIVPRLPVTFGGIVYMFAVYIRKLLPCFILGSFLIATTSVSKFLAAITKLRLSKGLTIALAVTLRYFPTMREEWASIRDAMALRGISASAAGLISHPRSEYHTGEAAYEDISHMILLPQKAAEPQPPVINKPAGAETLPDEDDTIWPEVDFAVLREINPDIVAWIYIEGTKINYPIVQGGDNSYYLKHLFSGEWNGSGCIFLDFRNDASFADRHSIIYGHHMKNGTMFTGIDKYKKQEFFDEHPVALLITPDKNYKVDFFAGYVAAPQDDAWEIGFTEAEFEVWLQNAADRSCFTSEIAPNISDHILTLSTCSYEFDDARFVLAGVLR